MQLRSLQIDDWRQFDGVSIDFHPELTVVTGANGAGKTTILNMLSRLIGWSVALLAIPERDRKAIFSEVIDLGSTPGYSPKKEPAQGNIILGNGRNVALDLGDKPDFSFLYPALDSVKGVYITSHRHLMNYTSVKHIPTTISAAEQILQLYTERFRAAYQQQKDQVFVKAEQSPTFRLKEALISLAVFGEGNSVVSANSDSLETFRGFEAVLRKVLPQSLDFRRLYIRMPEVLVVTGRSAFPLEAVSGGISAIIDLAWQIFLASRVYEDFIVLIDEPENHLHPTLQKTIMSSLVSAFPTAQFVVSTHSPLIITSVEKSAVYVLQYDDVGSVSSVQLDLVNKSSYSEEILRSVLGVETSKPQWASQKIEEVIARYEGKLDDGTEMLKMSSELKQAGVDDDLTYVLQSLIERSNDKIAKR